MGKALIFPGVDFSTNAIGKGQVAVSWWYGMTSADMTPSGLGGPIYFTQDTIMKDQNGTWLQGKTIAKLRIWLRDRNQATATLSIGYLPAGWTAQTDFVAVKTLNKDELNMTLYSDTAANTENGKNDIALNMTLPAGALFGVQVTGCYIMVAAGGNNGTVKDDYKKVSSNGSNYVNWTPGIDFGFEDGSSPTPSPTPDPDPDPDPDPEPSQGNIVFADAAVKTICVTNWGSDGEITYAQAAVVTGFSNKFKGNTSIASFNEMQYFGVTGLDSQAFANCSALKSVTFPASLQSIGGNAFYGSAIESIGSSAGITTLSENAFWNTPLAGEISLPAITSIGNNVFRGTHITKIDLGPNLTSIGNFAFSGAGAVVVILRATTPPTISASNVFDNTATFYVPYSADHSVLAEYKAATGWSGHSARIYELTEDGNIPT